jgi:hypothetical protein
MFSHIPLSYCRIIITRNLLSAAMVFLIAVVFSVVTGPVAEAAPKKKTSFTAASPKGRAGVTYKNGETVTLKVTLWDGKRVIPGKVISFFITKNKDKVLFGKAITDSTGVATLKKPIRITVPPGKKWVGVPWEPLFEGDDQYQPPQNNNIGGGFGVRP